MWQSKRENGRERASRTQHEFYLICEYAVRKRNTYTLAKKKEQTINDTDNDKNNESFNVKAVAVTLSNWERQNRK